MERLYADEDFPYPVVDELRRLGHDLLTVAESGRAGQKIPDEDVLAYAVSLNRTVITLNKWDYIRLHKQTPNHWGIVVCSKDDDFPTMAVRIDQELTKHSPLANKLVRVNRPP